MIVAAGLPMLGTAGCRNQSGSPGKSSAALDLASTGPKVNPKVLPLPPEAQPLPPRVPTPHAPPLPEPKHEAFGCFSNLQQRTTCAKLGKDCALEAEPSYWVWPRGPQQGKRLSEEAREAALKEVHSRKIPPCMCTCDPKYERLEQLRRPQGPPPA